MTTTENSTAAAPAIDLTSVAAVAGLLGLSNDEECTPDGIDWGHCAGPADGAPVFLLPGYSADDGNCTVHYEHAETGADAAQEYVSDGDWGDDDSTTWVHVHTWQVCVSVDADGRRIEGRCDEGSHRVEIEPEEPECVEGGEHDWQSPPSLLGGLAENPGVMGHGGGVTIEEVCMRCGCGRTTDTWAQDRETGEQGLRSVSYEPGKYAADIPSREEHELSDISCDELRRGAAHVLSAVREALIVDTDGGPSSDVPERGLEVGEYVRRVSRAVCAAGNVDRERRAIRLALWLAARDRREAHAAGRICALAGIGGW